MSHADNAVAGRGPVIAGIAILAVAMTVLVLHPIGAVLPADGHLKIAKMA